MDVDSSGLLEARLQPWLWETLAGLSGGVRRESCEQAIGIFNMPTQGVTSSGKLHFMLQQITSLCHLLPKSFIAVIVLPNRAGDIRTPAVKSGTYFLHSSSRSKKHSPLLRPGFCTRSGRRSKPKMMTMMVVLLRTVKRLVKVVWGQESKVL